MTQIKLRRDTSANFTSKNPVLGAGEPAYETDTKKLKIGDGTTAYNTLAYFSSGGGGSSDITATLPLKIVDGVISLEVDGQTIQIVDGKLHANLDELGNEVNTLAGDVASVQADLLNKQDKSTAVTTDTAQNISGQKEFNKTILFLSNDDLLRAQQSEAYRNGAGLSMGANSTSTDGGVFAPQWKIYNTTGDVDRTETIITTYNQSKLNTSNFNTANKLVKLDSDGKLPAIDGSNLTNLPSGSAPANMVTTDTTQTITGAKTFNSYNTVFKNITANGQVDATTIRASNSEFTQMSVGLSANTWDSYLIIGSGTGDEAKFGYQSINKATYILPPYNSNILHINNYDDGSSQNGLATDVIISGNLKNKVNNVVSDVLTSSDKETIMGYMMPDYSTRTAVPWNTDNTALTDGYVEVFGEGDGSTSAFVLEYTLSGVKTAVSSCYATSANTNFRLPVICPKGTVYSARGGAIGHELHFISMKGSV